MGAALAARLGFGLGRAKTPQFVIPRITPPFWRMRFPAMRAMLALGVSYGRGLMDADGLLFHFCYAAWADLGLLLACIWTRLHWEANIPSLRLHITLLLWSSRCHRISPNFSELSKRIAISSPLSTTNTSNNGRKNINCPYRASLELNSSLYKTV